MIKVHKILEHKNLQNSTINYSGVSTESEWTYYYNNLILLILPRNQYPSENGYYAGASAIARTTRACISKCHFL